MRPDGSVVADCLSALLATPFAHAQCSVRSSSTVIHAPVTLSSAQIAELDREGAAAAEPLPGKPPISCPDVLDRVARAQRTFLEQNSEHYLVLPNGDVINAYRGLRLRAIEDSMRFARGNALDRLQRQFHELAPCGEHMLCHDDGTMRYLDAPPPSAQEGETTYEFVDLPPMFEMPVRPHADTTAAHVIVGSRLADHRGNDFHIDQQTDHWLLGRTVLDGTSTPQRIAVLRDSARIVGNRLERSCVLWPLNRTAEGRRDYWDRAPLPLFVALNADDIRATPADLACAAERGRVMLRSYSVRSDRSRPVSIEKRQSGDGFVRKRRSYGAWQNRVIWRANPVSLRITDAQTHAERIEQRIRAEDRAFEAQKDGEREGERNADRTPAVTHRLVLKDGRVLEGRLTSDASANPVAFTIVVGSLAQPSEFRRHDVDRIEAAD